MSIRNRPRFTAGTVLLLLAIAALLAFWYAKRVFIQPGNETAPMPGSEFADNEALSMPESGRPLVYEELSPGLFVQLLSGYETPAYLRWEVQTAVYAESAARTRLGTLEREGGDYRLTLEEAGRRTRTVVKSGDTVTVDGGTRVSYSAAYTPLRQLGMADIDYLLDVRESDILEVAWSELDGRQVLYVALADPEIKSQTEYYWVSLELGLPLRCETYDGDRLTYLATTLSVSTQAPKE